MLRHLDLFSGIGGFSLGLERTGGFKTVAFCECEPFCQKILNKHWPDIPIYEDIRKVEYDGTVDIITGGLPCQPFSIAGKRKGQTDDRYLWPEMFDCIKKYQPRWIIVENVTGIINMELDSMLLDLENKNYTCQTFIIPACAVNAHHQRNRIWILANSNKPRFSCQYETGNSKKETRKKFSWSKFVGISATNRAKQWKTEPTMGRVVNGVPRRVDRLKALGNAVVPQIPEILGYAILEIERGTH